MWAAIIRWITGDLVGQLTRAYEVHQAAKTGEQTLIANVVIEDIKRQIADRAAAKEIRLATAPFWEMRLITATIAGCFAFHLLLVTLDTCFKLGWRIPAFPKPFDEWQGAILLSFFGVQAVSSAIGGIAAAIRGRR